MGNQALPIQGAAEFLGPDDAGEYVGTPTSITASTALRIDLPLDNTKGETGGGAYFTFEARGGDVNFRFVAAGATAGTTTGNASNGSLIPSGTQIHRWVSARHPSIDVNSTASCTLFWWKSSPNYANRPPLNG